MSQENISKKSVTKSSTSLNSIHRLQGALLNKTIMITHNGKTISVVPTEIAEDYINRAYNLKGSAIEKEDFKVESQLKRLNKLVEGAIQYAKE